MATSDFPQLGYPCLTHSTSIISLVGLQYAPSDAKEGEAGTYTIQSYTAPITKNLTSIAFTATPSPKPRTVQPSATSRMICAQDPATGTLLYIFNENVYIEDPKTSAAEPIAKWNAARNIVPQVAWAKNEGQGQFQWLGLNNGNWTTIDIDATNGVSAPTPASVPADVPSTGIYSVIREQPGSFLVIYNKSSITTAARFNLGDGASKAVDLDGLGSLSFFSMPKAQDAGKDYFFGSAFKNDNKPFTFTASVETNQSKIALVSTRDVPRDDRGPVPQVYDYGAATMFELNRGLIYGGQVDAKNNTWSFGMATILTSVPDIINFHSYNIIAPDGTPGAFAAAAYPPKNSDDDSKGLSTPAIIGIAVGAVALLMLIVLFAIFHRRNKKIEKRMKDQEGLDMAVRDLQSKSSAGMAAYQPRFASTHSLLDSETNTTARGQSSPSTERPAENLTLRVPIVRYDGRDVAQSVPHALLGSVVLSQYRLGQMAVNSKMVVIQLGENVDTAESVTLKWVRDEIVWQREAAMLNHIVNPSKIISLHQTMIIPGALEWRHILVLDAHESTLDFMLSTHAQRLLDRSDQRAVAKALLSGLAWCHEKDVIHLAICTGSLVLNEEGQWVLWSFGAARFLNEAVGPRQGSLIGQENGTVERNLSPELLNARRENRLDSTLSTPAMDAWAAGCVLFEILTGQALFRTEEAADQAATGKFNAWRDRLVEITDADERKIVEGLLVMDPTARLSLTKAVTQFV
ncbi:negative regulator of the PHO system [Mortierella sp. NVP85]|nr:negative regulator of the PHO system [Mortierella sp. NVP85]